MSVVGLVLTALFGALFVRLWYLQVAQAPSGRLAALTNTVRTIPSPPPRGIMVARGGQVLAGNTTQMVVTLDRQAAQAHPAVIGRLAKLLGITAKAVKGDLANQQYSPYAPVPVAVGVPLQTVVTMRENQSYYPGAGVQLRSVRSYPQGTTASHLLGYVGQIDSAQLARLRSQGYLPGDQIGVAGAEQSMQKWLRGVPGATKVQVNAAGQVVSTVSKVPAQQGDTVVLNLDLGLQKAVDQILASEISSLHSQGFPATGGASVVLDPRNGAVLAMASYPTYNPSVWTGGISSANYAALTSPSGNYPLINRAIEGLYTPGSTFKLATATAALKDGLITPNTLIADYSASFTVPGCTVGKCTFRDLAEAYPPGPINVTYALSASNDIFFYTLGYRFWEAWVNNHQYGQDAIQTVANAYSLGNPAGTGIDLPGELGGAVDSYATRAYNHKHYPASFPSPPSWYVGDNIEMAFGQAGTVITPLELADAYATFANGGTRYAPQIAAGVVSPSGKLIKRFAPRVMGHVTLPPADRAAMVAGFRGAVTKPWGTAYGTFVGFPFSQLSVAGKTGTASTNFKQPNSLFAAFAPVTNSRYVVATVISQAGYGATGAAVATRNILQYLATHPVPSPKLP